MNTSHVKCHIYITNTKFTDNPPESQKKENAHEFFSFCRKQPMSSYYKLIAITIDFGAWRLDQQWH